MEDIRDTLLKCKDCKVTACPFCEYKGIIANMVRTGDVFKCLTCGTEVKVHDD
jgi:hypothetical protein